MLIDTHCHLDDERFKSERDQIIKNAQNEGVETLITIGCDVENSKSAQKIAQSYNGVYFSAGVHPHEAKKAPTDFIGQLEKIAAHEKCVAIGECGLDYYYKNSPKDAQKAVFLEQIDLAKKLNKALIIHVRDAWSECSDILAQKKLGPKKVIIHCFSGTWEHAQKFLALGCIISLSGIVTFKNPGDLVQVAQKVPLDCLVVETDAPYLAPIPHRGKRNEPKYVIETAKKIAEIKNIGLEELAAKTTKNAQNVFGIK
ncbi:TatD family hydrolase [Sulfobacillus acidophilus]|uniref:TatD family hydrolase n=1 Tax=Sulfobacillus acidophilus TaxID=53633 RepID=A0ABS3AVF9_9FIRM|nr:TatD family hydrolase [Sulfobacillus acidophilus]